MSRQFDPVNTDSADTRTALVIGHPGHELRVFRWLEINRPAVFVLTDGSGRSGLSRLAATTKILNHVGARKGSFYGSLTDVAAYQAILSHNNDMFVKLACELARYLISHRISYVAGDALEGYNPTHDVCRLVIGTAVEIASRQGEHTVGNFEFPLAPATEERSEEFENQVIRVKIDDQAFARKVSVALGYAELRSEVEAAINDNNGESIRVERLWPVSNRERGERFANVQPYYEQYGEKQVKSGHYSEVIRYREHILPLADALWHQVEKGV